MARPAGSPPRLVAVAVATLLTVATAACGDPGETSPSTEPPLPKPSLSSTSPATQPTASPSLRLPRLSGRPIMGGAPPAWLGKRVLPRAANGFGAVRPTPPQLLERRFTLPDQLTALPGDGFASRVTTPAPPEVIARSTWKRGCPVAAADLSWLRLRFWGFDKRRHTGELLVNRSAADSLVSAFHHIYEARFPIEEMRITGLAELDAAPTGDGNNTSAFACRTTRGDTSYSQHAYGLEVDVNPFQNPYRRGDVVLPELASSYLDRSWVRPGMVTPDGPVVDAFSAIGWTWGGTSHSPKDLQHFSQNGH
jgi:hypothetical protein